MGIFKFKPALIGLTTVLSAATSLFSATVDKTFDNNQNDFEYYWYYYDDNAGCGADDRLQAKTPGTPSVIGVKTLKDTTNLKGTAIKQYEFTTGTEAVTGVKYASLPFTIGSNWVPSTYDKATPFVGIGTMLAATGKGTDISKATKLHFKIKSKSGAFTSVRCKIQDLPMDTYSQVLVPPKGAFGYFGKDIAVTTDWLLCEYVIPTDFTQPSWANATNAPLAPHVLDLTKATKIAWEVTGALPGTVDELQITDVELTDMPFISPSVWTDTVPMSPRPSTGEFSTFEQEFPSESPYGYWYAYNDAQILGNSTVTASTAAFNDTTKRLKLNFVPETGSDGAGKAAALDFVLGKPVVQGTANVQGFVGIGVNVYDSLNAKYWDATATGAKSIYFQYMLDSDAPYATLEISDVLDVADGTKPDGKDGRGSGVVWYRNLPNTNGVWKAVEIPFDGLIIHSDWVGSKDTPLDRTKLAKIQWKVQGAEGAKGIFSVDNIYFPGATFTSVKKLSHSNQSAGLNVSYLNGNVNVRWTNSAALTNGKISLVNMQGAVVASTSIAKTSNVNASFSTKTLPAGMYFVKLNAVNASGKAVVMQSKISYVK